MIIEQTREYENMPLRGGQKLIRPAGRGVVRANATSVGASATLSGVLAKRGRRGIRRVRRGILAARGRQNIHQM